MSGRMINNLIEVRQGDSFTILVHLFKNEQNLDLSGSIVRMQVRNAENQIIWTVEATSTAAEDGRLALILRPELTNIPVGEYRCDIELETTDGSINTIFPADVNQIGIFKITEQVTKED